MILRDAREGPPPMERSATRAHRIADKYITPNGDAPKVEVRPDSPHPGMILEQMIADAELLVIHGNDLDQCEACDVWLTMEEAVRCEDGPTLCPYQAYGDSRSLRDPCYRDRPWRHAHRHGFDKAEAVRRTAELMEAECCAASARGRP